MQGEDTRLSRVWDIGRHRAVPVARIYPVFEPGQVAAVMFGAGPGTLGVGGAGVVAGARAGAEDLGDVRGIGEAPAVAVVA
jgi:hypothetical protein